MVTDVYSHIIDEDRRKNAELFEEAYYGKKNLRPQMGEVGGHQGTNTITLPEGVDAEALAKVLGIRRQWHYWQLWQKVWAKKLLRIVYTARKKNIMVFH